MPGLLGSVECGRPTHAEERTIEDAHAVVLLRERFAKVLVETVLAQRQEP